MNIGFISTRFSGTDGVTLETSKWAQVFERNGFRCFWFAGELDRDPAASYLAEEAHFQNEANQRINAAVIGSRQRSAEVSDLIRRQSRILKRHLYRFLQKFDIDLLVAENILSLPMQIPLGLALTEVLAETGTPSIAHHHDFFWERDRYLVNAVGDFLQAAFPPRLPNMAHVVINSAASEELSRRTGIAATVVPNVIDFHQPPPMDMDAARSFRDHIGARSEDLVFLQPTRVVQRKGIEHAVHLVQALGRPGAKLAISHQAGDEGYEYAEWLERYARMLDVDLIFVDTHMDDPWGTHSRRFPQFSLYDIYPGADFVTYPSLCEGFGNGLLEAIYFKRPVMVNRYATYVRDIEPLGFELVAIDGFLTPRATTRVGRLLDDAALRSRVTETNFQIAKKHFSYQTVAERLNMALSTLSGTAFPKLGSGDSAAAASGQGEGGQRIDAADVKWAKHYN